MPVKLTPAEWKLLLNEVSQSINLALRYGNRKMVDKLEDIRLEIRHQAGYEEDLT